MFIKGLGAIAGPLVAGWMMGMFGPRGFWVIIAVLMLGLAGYAVWRMRVLPTKVIVGNMVSYAPLAATATSVSAGGQADAEPSKPA